jgi:hypothetical protein
MHVFSRILEVEAVSSYEILVIFTRLHEITSRIVVRYKILWGGSLKIIAWYVFNEVS